MPTIQDIDREIAKRNQMSAIDAEITKRESQAETSFGDDIVGGLEVGATILSGAVAEPISGIIGAYEAFKGGDPSALIPFMQKELTYQPKTDSGQQQIKAVGEFMQPIGEAFKGLEEGLGNAVFDATGNAELATIAHTLPTAALEALGVKSFIGKKTPSMSPDEIAKQKSFVSQGFEPKEFDNAKQFTDSAKKKQLDEVLASGDQERLAAMIDSDPDFFKALDELGVKEKGLPSASSKNRQYQETEQALKKMPGSDLSKKEFDQVAELQKISDDLITEFGGTTDKSSLSISLANDADRVIDSLNLTTEAAYNTIRDNIPKQTLSSMDNIGEYMAQELADLGGDISQLSALERRLLSMSEKGATYHALDKIRKEVGATIGKKSDKYKSEDVGALKRIYEKLTNDQEIVANDLDMGESWSAAKELVIQRKSLEDKSIQMFGKNLSDAFMPKMGLAMKKLTTGDYKKFNELLDSVPEGRKQEVIVSALNDVFTMGSRKEKQLNVAGYADWFNGLSKNGKLKKELYDSLPKELTVKLDAMGKVTNGIRNAQAAAPVGGQVMANAGVLDKVVNGVASRFLTKLPGIIGDVVSVGLEKSKGKGFDAAMDVLNDPDFLANIQALSKGQARKAAELEKRLMKKKKFKDFVNTLPANEAKAISVLGLTSWLSRSNEQQDEASTPEEVAQ
ncbi:MAG: putative DNA transfer protein [Prokaryotic dsDNA virus sp.]|nr:MAG: putative DNA transfer protein [Prokaryotic dsDNA virus sp.]|tara:strand:+ start:20214 stop:22253 length:2040 start_codon:yes stop_codon:yes gene_type:complete